MPPPRRLRPLLAVGLTAAALAASACRITPDEIQRIETENDLLREQIQSMRMECEQYRRIDIGVEKPAEQPPDTPEEPAPP